LKKRNENSLKLFHQAARYVPAYKDFLKKNKINPDKVKNINDFQQIPPTSKENYLRRYPIEKITWDGSLNKPLVFTATSGSTGEPFYFTRSNQLDWESSIIHEFFLKNGSGKEDKPTLVIVGFGMGVWIGGLITYKAFELASQRGQYPVSILTPGVNKEEILKAIRKLSPHYHQTILVGYPPFIKDVIDDAKEEGINLKKMNLRLLFAAEPFTENFRDHICKEAGVGNLYLDSMNIYGTADIGTMAHETPLSILIRRLSIKDKKIFSDIFPEIHKTPTLTQYNPLFINFEAPGGEILITGNSSIPLIRYSVGDHGGVYSFSELEKIFEKHGVSLMAEAKKAKIDKSITELPFVYVYERTDFSTTIYGLQIYPEYIREALLDAKLSHHVTGKFALVTKFDKKHNQYLEINIELRKGKKAGLKIQKIALDKIVSYLRKKSSEYKELSNHIGQRAYPKLVFWQAENPLYFKTGIKQKWVRH
jgi:phenylacetate-CoA ligase